MISEKERRGIVELLRDEADYWRDYRGDDDTLCMSDSDFTESVLEAFGFDATAVPVYEVFDKLADLTDHPTCRDVCGRSRGDAAQEIGEVIGALRYHERHMTSVPPKIASHLAEHLERAAGEL